MLLLYHLLLSANFYGKQTPWRLPRWIIYCFCLSGLPLETVDMGLSEFVEMRKLMLISPLSVGGLQLWSQDGVEQWQGGRETS